MRHTESPSNEIGARREGGSGTLTVRSEPVGRVAVAVAPNGARRSKADHPALPTTPAELARTASECLEAGAAMIHLHVRDRDSRHLLDVEAYRAAMEAIRAAVGDRLVVQVTSEAVGVYSATEQMSVIKALRPEAVSLALSELAPAPSAEPEFLRFLSWMRSERIAPQIILYTPDEAVRLSKMRERGLPFPDLPVLYVLGRYTSGQIAQARDLLPFLAEEMPRFRHWMTCAFGRYETACVTAGALFGGHVRVGFENNLARPDGTIARSNAELVVAVATALEACACDLADADDLRRAWSFLTE